MEISDKHWREPDGTVLRDIDILASTTECTGLIPAVPWDGDTHNQRELYNVHKQPGEDE